MLCARGQEGQLKVIRVDLSCCGELKEKTTRKEPKIFSLTRFCCFVFLRSSRGDTHSTAGSVPPFGINTWHGALGSPGVVCTVQEGVKCHLHHQERLALVLGGKNAHPKCHGITCRLLRIPKLPGRMFHVLSWTCSSNSLPFPKLCCCLAKWDRTF